MNGQPFLQIEDLHVEFAGGRRFLRAPKPACESSQWD